MSQTSDIKRKLKKKVNKIVEDALYYCKEEIASEIEKHFESYIDEFYAHYPNPISYDPRTFRTYLASDGFNDFSVMLSKGENRIGIYVTADNIEGNPYYVPGKYGLRKNGKPVDKDWVFENTFERGMHGIPPTSGHYPMDKPPYVNMKTWFKDFKSNKGQMQNKIKERALIKAIQKNL